MSSWWKVLSHTEQLHAGGICRRKEMAAGEFDLDGGRSYGLAGAEGEAGE